LVENHYGDALLIQKRPELKRRILLVGHMDTVFSAHHAFQKIHKINDNRLNGPGVSDMKGGLLVMRYALEAFEKSSDKDTLGWDVLINADEELGSPASSATLSNIAPRAQLGLVYEPAMNDQGLFAKNRRGSGKITLIAKGKAAHVGRAFHEGRNAITHLAKCLVMIDALNGKRPDVTINIGKISGGDALNMVPDIAVAKCDIRINDSKDEEWVMHALDSIIEAHQQPGFELILQGHFGRPGKHVCHKTERLFERINHIGLSLGLNLSWKDSGGCCDGNNLSALGLPVIDTLGVRGGDIHTENEYILLDSLIERTMLTTLLLQDLAKGGLEEITA